VARNGKIIEHQEELIKAQCSLLEEYKAMQRRFGGWFRSRKKEGGS
jgi:hypothetical protein